MRNRSTDAKLIKTAARLGRPSVYALARALKRPYRRVLSRVKTLARAGQLELLPATRGGRAVLQVCPPAPASKPPKPLPLAWSRPSGRVPAATAIAAALLRPTFSGLLDVSRRYGLARVERAARELDAEGGWIARTREDASRALGNLRAAHARAAARH
ncbi:MAG TPA: hypothetical protein VKU44_00375 [Terriglobia bacterium]|nr:hypothetical protein [Terriglobia bacterium]